MEKTMTMNRVLCAVLTVMLMLALVPTYAFAETTASGTWGTCEWDIQDGVLTIHEGEGIDNSNISSPWRDYKDQITKVKTDGVVVLPAKSIYLFHNMRNLSSIDLSGFDASSVIDMSNMFYGCKSLKELDLPSLNTLSVKKMTSAFEGCTELTELDLSNFDTSQFVNTQYMFEYCANLKTIYVSDLWNIRNIYVYNTSSMFKGCTSLVGGNGTAYSDSNPSDKTYARIDTPETPGYLTLKLKEPSFASNITIETEPSTINVTVPTNATFVFKSDGSNVYPSNYEITNNNGLTAITLDAIDFEGVNGWSLTTEDDTFQADVKKFALKMGLKDGALSVVDKDNGVTFADETEIKIAPNSSKSIDFEAKRGVFSQPVTTENAMLMTMHFDWERL